ncbi:MAG: M1 family metallopeptidase [Chitinophagaceae bacterium]
MYKFIMLCTLSSFFILQSQAQDLYMPRNVKNAIKKQTRELDGKPGKNYWQNYGRYNITVTAMPPDRNIKGSEQITYINNSPDTLKNIVFKLILNIHKPGALRFGNADSDYLTSGVHIDNFLVNNTSANWNSDHDRTYKTIKLAQSLLPHDSVHLAVDWHYQISLQSGREGMIDSTTYYLAYFYPRVAVYDDYNGWDKTDFTEFQEFYNDFNDYTFTVNVPANYIVWATGNLLNADEVLQPKIAQLLQQSFTSDDVIHLATKEDLNAKNITQNKLNSWKWKADYVTDIAIGLSDHFNWDAGSVVVDDATHRRASVQSAYNDTAQDFHHMVSFGKHALDWLSHNWPGIPYPYPKSTIFQGYADMEYPMMVNDATTEDTIFSRFVAEHEIAHTYFPFYMGINETRYGFMDEGWATTLELLIGRADLGNEKADEFYKQFRVERWIHDPSAEEDIPIITPGNMLAGEGLGNNEYGKPSLGYLAVKDLLGDDLFKKALREYMNRWHGKHPIPWDFFNSISNASGKNLNWFWTNWYFSNNYIDFALQKVDKTKNGYAITIQNIGGMVAPFDVQLNYDDGTSETFHQTPEIWSTNQKQTTINISSKKNIQSAELKGGIFMDADETNNVWKK